MLLSRFIKWIVSLFVHEAVEQVKEEINKPTTMTDEKVPDSFKRALDADLRSKLRSGDGGNLTEGSGSSGQ
jgi:hypothetical protein